MGRDWNDFIEPLYYNEYERLFNIAYRKTGSIERAEELVQEVFLLAIFDQERLIEHPKPGAWLMVTLYNLIKNELRLSSHREISLDEAIAIPGKERETQLEELLPAQLSPADREILLWRFEAQISYAEMSGRLGVSPAACRKRVSQAVNKCKRLLDI